MANTEQSNYRLDKEAKAKAYAIFAQIGLKPTDAVNMFMHYVAMHGRLPFQPRVPQEVLDRQNAA